MNSEWDHNAQPPRRRVFHLLTKSEKEPSVVVNNDDDDDDDDGDNEEEEENAAVVAATLSTLLTPDMEHFQGIVKYLPTVDRFNLAEAFISYGSEVYGYIYHPGLPRELCIDYHKVRYFYTNDWVIYDPSRKEELQHHSFCICRSCLFF